MATTLERQRWVKQMEEDFPGLKGLGVAQKLIDLYVEDRKAFNKLVQRAKDEPPPDPKKTAQSVEVKGIGYISPEEAEEIIKQSNAKAQQIVSIESLEQIQGDGDNGGLDSTTGESPDVSGSQ